MIHKFGPMQVSNLDRDREMLFNLGTTTYLSYAEVDALYMFLKAQLGIKDPEPKIVYRTVKDEVEPIERIKTALRETGDDMDGGTMENLVANALYSVANKL